MATAINRTNEKKIICPSISILVGQILKLLENGQLLSLLGNFKKLWKHKLMRAKFTLTIDQSFIYTI